MKRSLTKLLAGCGGAALLLISAPPTLASMRDDVQPPARAAAAEPDHHYRFVDGTLYGYQPVLSEAERQAGKLATALVMFRYHGVRNGRTQLSMNLGGGVSQVMDCTEPCTTLRMRLFSGWREVKREYIELVPGMVVGFALSDARRGKLKLHRNRDGKYIFFGESRAEESLFTSPKAVGGT